MGIDETEVTKIFEQSNAELIELKNCNKNLFNLKIGLLNSFLNAITEKKRNKKYEKIIKDTTSKADIIYLFHDSILSQIPKGPIVIGSFHERNPNPKAYSLFGSIFIILDMKLIKYKVLFKRIEYYHYQALNLKPYVPKSSFYIPLSIDATKYLPYNNIIDHDDIIRLLSVDRLVKSKGIDILVDAFNIVKGKGRYELHVVGSGEMEYFIKNLKINGLVFHSLVNDETLIQLYKYCDVFVFPSTSDRCGLIVLEALASIEYIIVNDSLKGVFDDFEHLNILEHSKHDSLDVANRIMSFKKKISRYNKDVDLMIREKYDWPVIEKKLYDKFQELVNNNLTSG